MKMSRIKSSRNNMMPLRQQNILKHQQQLRQKTRELLSKPSSQTSFRKISTALFTNTSRSNAFFKPHTQQRNRQTAEVLAYRPQSQAEFRPFTHSTSRCHRVHSPLSIIQTRSKALSRQQSENLLGKSQNFRIKNEFLRKGSSIDRAVISNILKSKLNKNVCAPAFAYCDMPQNKELVSVISKQIPYGVRDVVGAEEMVRMSHIFTGTRLKYISLTKRINVAINDVQFRIKNRKKSQDQQSITLKSIKRW